LLVTLPRLASNSQSFCLFLCPNSWDFRCRTPYQTQYLFLRWNFPWIGQRLAFWTDSCALSKSPLFRANYCYKAQMLKSSQSHASF
jgi:hypothetical protein